MSRLYDVYKKENLTSYIAPLFWQHGEDEHLLRDEIQKMHENGIGAFIVESRPHPDYMGEKWWHDLDVIFDEAEKRNMKVWMLDDKGFPSGLAAGKIRDFHPEHLKVYLVERHIDAKGPLTGSSFRVQAWLKEGEKLIRVVAARRTDGVDQLDPDSLTDITGLMDNGVLYWDVPDGDWRVFIMVKTREGGEYWTVDYINPLDYEAVRLFIKYIYVEHYKRYKDKFGKTFAGFFSDEPRLGNTATYEGIIGKFYMELPYATDLLEELSREWGSDFGLVLPLLWYDAGELSIKARYTFMDVVSRRYGECFSMQIGDWCRAHNVKHIGHIVEDNGAHARLGFGCGHFYRAISGQSCSGLDVVYQVWPEYTSGRFNTPFGYLYADFFYWGITKMASSAGHLDPKKNGTTVCEVFGAYGWQEGLKLMKWLTDHICVQGVNFIIPHAFTPKYPDPDCPPHFYARGMNPQWPYFHIWSKYANRVCHLLSGGRHIAPVAVLYHAEAEWADECMGFEKVLAKLTPNQLDSDVVPIDALMDDGLTRVVQNRLNINDEWYKALVIPYARYLPLEFMDRLLRFSDSGLPVIFVDGYPAGSSTQTGDFNHIISNLANHPNVMICSLITLPEQLRSIGAFDIEPSAPSEYLQYYHYTHGDNNIYFFTNGSKTKHINTWVLFKEQGRPVGYDAMENKLYSLDYTPGDNGTMVKLILEPYESLFVIFDENLNGIELYELHIKRDFSLVKDFEEINGKWKVSVSKPEDKGKFMEVPQITGPGNVAVPGIMPDFSGTIRYETEFEWKDEIQNGRVYIDLSELYETAEVSVNNIPVGVRICPPYRFEITEALKYGWNQLCIDITNTLAKSLGDNMFDRGMPQEPSGLIGPVKIIVHHND